MSRLDQLISQYCPAGVPMVRLGEVCEIKRGERLVRKDLDKIGEYPVFQNSLTPLGFYSSFNREKYTPFVISAGAAGSVGICSSEYWAADDCFTLDETCNIAPKYLYYGLLNQEDFLKSKIRGGAMKRLARDIVENLSIPLPPLPVQEEIVRILDAMSDLVTNLDAEISARQKQYEHAREKLLTFGEEVERKTLGEIANNHDKDRRPITENQRKKGIYPYYGASGIVDYVEGYIYDGDYLLVSEDGANLVMRSTPIAFSIHGKTWVNNHAHVLSFDSSYTHKFVEFYLNSIDLAPDNR